MTEAGPRWSGPANTNTRTSLGKLCKRQNKANDLNLSYDGGEGGGALCAPDF